MKKWLIILLVLVAGLNIVLFWFYKQAGLKKQNQVTQPVAQSPAAQYPYFPANTETFLDTEKTWQSASFQPIFKELVEAGTNKWYILVNYSTSAGGALEGGKIFLGVGAQIPYIDKSNNKTIIDSVKLKDELRAGDQFGITYLSKIPVDFSINMPYCQDYPKAECLFAHLKQESDKNGEKVFYPFTVYRILKQ